MTSDIASAYTQAYVWIWLPNSAAPVVAGVLSRDQKQLIFNYGRSYLARADAIAIYAPELPLQAGAIPLLPGLAMPGCIRDASPDAWGRRVLINRKHGARGADAATIELDELTYLLESGSDRIGALDFQLSPTRYLPRRAQQVSLEELLTAAEKVEHGIPLSAGLDLALQHGTSLGGARPKVLMEDGNRQLIAKFSASNDLYNVVKAEFIAMRLAAQVGLDVAPVQLTSALGKDVLLIERFDRQCHQSGWLRRAMVSALTMLEFDEMMAAYASYEKLAEIIRHRFLDPKTTLRELFGRIVFNILCGNTDDHARNHAAFWDGQHLALTPAYDICPQPRAGQEASQAMLISGGDRRSQLTSCMAAAPIFLLKPADAIGIVNTQVTLIEQEWNTVCGEANLSEVDRNFFWRRQFLNPFAFYGAPDEVRMPQG
ncbi:MAG: type II toxin-antitoxin system HipA family toxin [Comamonadaceae bacterium]|nr:type II toxin-antitoxin system HipA family toxin [Comamonadaceae bacterium]